MRIQTTFRAGLITLTLLLANVFSRAQTNVVPFPLDGAILASDSISLSGNGIEFDSFDSSDPLHSVNGLYDPSVRKANGDLKLFSTNILSLGNANIFGSVYTAPLGSVDIRSSGSVGDTNWVSQGTAGIQFGHWFTNLNGIFPPVVAPDISFGSFPLQNVFVATTNIVSSNATAVIYPPSVPSGNLISVTTNTSFVTSTNFPVPGSYVGIITTNQLFTNQTVMMTNNNVYPPAGTYVGNVTTNIVHVSCSKSSPGLPSEGNYIPGTLVSCFGNHYGYDYYQYIYLAIVGGTTQISYSYNQILSYSVVYTASTTNVVTNFYNQVFDTGSYNLPVLTNNILIRGDVTILANQVGFSGNDGIQIATNGLLKLYVSGAASFSGKGITSDSGLGLASRFVYYGLPSNSSISFHANGKYVGCWYAPSATFSIVAGGNDGLEFFGAVVARSVSAIGHPLFHYDEALRKLFPPTILSQPQSITRSFGQSGLLTVEVDAASTAPLHYQWLKNGLPAVDFFGQPYPTSSSLLFAALTQMDRGDYQVVITNVAGAITSAVAHVTVLDPQVIVTGSTNLQLGDTLQLQAAVIDSSLKYQWLKDRQSIPGATNAQLIVTNVTWSDGGEYMIVVSNMFGVFDDGFVNVSVEDPVVLSAPTDQILPAGSDATFCVSVAGTGPIRYSWFDNNKKQLVDGGRVSGANNSCLTLKNVTADDENAVVVIIGSDHDAHHTELHDFFGTLYLVAGLKVTEPTIASAPSSISRIAGTTATFSVKAFGSGPMTYQWLHGTNAGSMTPVVDGGRISGAQSTNLTIANVSLADAMNYAVSVVTARGSNGVSSVASLAVVSPPVVTSPLSSQNVNLGETAVLTAGFGGGAATYSWTKDGSPISEGGKFHGAASTSLTITDVGQNEAGVYAVTATNLAGSTTTSATLAVTDPLSITTPLTSVTKNAGETAVFTVTGGVGVSYAWSKDGGPALTNGGAISGADTASLTIAGVLKPDQGVYTVTLGNGARSTNSSATLTVIDPAITNQPVDTSVNLGANSSLSVGAVGSATLKYQWYFKNAPVKNGTNSVLAITAATTAMGGTYFAVVTNQYGKATSSVVTLTVVTAPTFSSAAPIVIKPKTIVPAGTRVVMSTATKGTAPSYQWNFEAAPIAGATTATNIIDAVTLAQAGNYTVTISNSAGLVTSVNALLTVVTDTNAPVVLISKPSNMSISSSSTNPAGTFVAFGTASDNAKVTNVFYRLSQGTNIGAWTAVQTFAPKDASALSATWTNVLNAYVGTNVLETYSADWSGNTSKVAKVVFFFHVPSRLNVSIDEHDTRAGEGTQSAWPADYRAMKPASTIAGEPFLFPTNGQTLYVNRGVYTLTAIAGHNQLFTNWASWITGENTTNYITTAKLEFVMNANLNLQANFIHNPWMEAQGTYSGLFTNEAVDSEISGFITLKVMTNQAYSGKLLVDGDSVSLSGKFNTGGTQTLTLSRAKLGKKPLVLSITNLFGVGSSGTNQIVGSLTDSNLTAGVVADQWIYTKTNYPTPGQFTMILSKSDDATVAPGGYGYQTMTVDGSGKVMALGALGDGTVLSPQVANVSLDRRWPMFNQIYATKMSVVDYTNNTQFHVNSTFLGMYLGWVNLTNPMAGTLRWVKIPGVQSNLITAPVGSYTNAYPNGFSLDVPLTLRSYVQRGATSRLIDLTNAIVRFADGNLPDGPQSQAVQLKMNNTTGIWGLVKVITKQTNGVAVTSVTNMVLQVTTVGTNAALGKLALTFDAKTGKMSGSFTNAISLLPTGTAKPITFTGAVLQPDNVAYGYFMGTNQSGSVTLQVDPINP